MKGDAQGKNRGSSWVAIYKAELSPVFFHEMVL
jgi:hypothetical protein